MKTIGFFQYKSKSVSLKSSVSDETFKLTIKEETTKRISKYISDELATKRFHEECVKLLKDVSN